MSPRQSASAKDMDGYSEEWICYKCDDVSAKKLTVFPGRKVKIKDSAAYGVILVQGYGIIGVHSLESPTLIRYGQVTCDEYFVTHKAANDGVWIENLSNSEPLVMLKHFADNPDLATWKQI